MVAAAVVPFQSFCKRAGVQKSVNVLSTRHIKIPRGILRRKDDIAWGPFHAFLCEVLLTMCGIDI